MKKIFYIMLCALTIFSLNLFVNKVDAVEVVESASYGDMIIRTAENNGGAYTDATLVDYVVLHGSVLDNTLTNFTTYNKESGWAATLGAFNEKGEPVDNAACNHYKLYTLANDGIVAKITAKSNVSIDINRTAIGGWQDPAVLGIYKELNGSISTIAEFEINSSHTAADFSFENIELASGDSLYYSFKFPWTGSHRNMEELPTFKFTKVETVTPDPVVPDTGDVPSETTESVKFSDMIIFTAMKEGNNYTDYELVDFGVKHGSVANNNINNFTTYSADEANWKGSLGVTGEDAYTQENWKIFTHNNDGFIFEFKAKYPINVVITKSITAGSWVDATNLNVYKKSESDVELVKTIALSDSTPAADYTVEVDLAKGETLYWEFVFPWTGDPRNMQDLPIATFTYIKPHKCDFTGEWKSDSEHHWHECECGEIDEKVAHSGGEATETEEAVCEICGTSYGELLNHTHIYSSEWTYDEEYHWHAATCEHSSAKDALDKHELIWEVVTDATITEDGEEKGICACGYEEIRVLPAVLPDYPDYSNLNEIGLNDLAIGVAMNNGGPVALKSMDVNLLQGNVFIGTRGFDNYSINVSDKVNVLLSDTDQFDGEQSAAFTTWRIKTTASSAAIFEIKATEDIKLTISHAAFNEGWIDEYGQYFGLYLKANNKIFTQWEKAIDTNVASENQYGGTIMLKAGDVCYFVFGSTMATQRNVNIVPTFTASTEEYDENARNKQMVLAEESVNMWDALSATINNEYNDIDYNTFSFGFYYGNVKELIKFDNHVGDGTGTAEDALWDSVALNTGFKRWQIQCSSGKNAIMKITAKENVLLNIAQPVDGDSAAFKVEWATFTAVRYYAVDSEGTRVLLKNIPVITGMKADYFNISVNLEAGQTLFIDYYTMNDDWGSLDFRPVVTASTENYNSNNLVDFAAVKALNNLKVEKIDALNEMLDGLDEFDYSINNWGKIQNYIEEALVGIEEAQTADEINSLFNNATTSVENVKTLAEEKVELDAYKKEKVDELNSLVAGLNKKDYTEENWKLITDKVVDITEKINKAKNKTSVDTLLANAKTFINNVAVTKPNSSSSNGCGGSVVPAIFGLISLLSLLVIFKKKKLEN